MTALRLLVVEDNELNRALVRAIITRAGDPVLREAEIIEAHTLAQARAVLSDTPVDAVLLDVQLPDGSGLALLDDLPGSLRGRRPVIVAVTGGVMPEQRAAAIAAGCDAIVTKPYVAADLTQTLSAHLMQREPGTQR
ncbi:MAG: response regulator [Actinobacteria bacterium 13_2_20CM_2_71_6]|nr:MAG: response regulator [Actinobacteria bacterium 13_2_20CM_2_71_6]